MVYDIDAARAQRLEAVGGEKWLVKLNGITYGLPREVPWELADRIEELETADGIEGVRAIMEALTEGTDFPLRSLSAQDMAGMLQAWMAEVGATLGESETSPGSSESTARPSKQTSKRSTGSRSRTSTAAKSRGGASKP